MAATKSSLESQAETIRDESTAGANTATRVGTFMRELMTWLVAYFKPLSDEGTTLDFGTNATSWDFVSDTRQSARWKAIITANTTVSFANDAGLTEQTGTIVASNTATQLNISDADSWYCNGLPSDGSVTWDFANQRLEFTPASASTSYILQAKRKTDGDWVFVLFLQNANNFGGSGGGASAFTDLTDGFASYTGKANDLISVKGTEDGLESKPVVELDLSTVVGKKEFTALEDTFGSYTGKGGDIVGVNTAEDGLESNSTVELGLTEVGAGSVTADTIFRITYLGETYEFNVKKI